jgi:hypothetical protein
MVELAEEQDPFFESEKWRSAFAPGADREGAIFPESASLSPATPAKGPVTYVCIGNS